MTDWGGHVQDRCARSGGAWSYAMQIDVITPIPTRWRLCAACDAMLARAGAGEAASAAALDDLPPEARREFMALTAMTEDLGRVRPGLLFRLVDPRSLPGLWMMLRHGVRRTPAFVVPGVGTIVGADRAALAAAIAAAAAPPQAARRPQRSRFVQAVRDFLYGATVYEMVRDLQKERGHLEHLFVLVVFGDFLGIPVLPPYYTLRLLPYVVPAIRGWKLSMLRERDFTELFVEEIH